MAGDRRCSDLGTTHYYTCPRPKIAKRNGYLIGASGHGAACGYVVDHFPILKPDKAFKPENIIKYVELDIKNQLREWLIKEKIVKDLSNKEEPVKRSKSKYKRREDEADVEVGALLVFRGLVFYVYICDDSVLIEQVPSINGAGCGRTPAIAAMTSTANDPHLTVADRLRLGIKSAAAYSWGCDDQIDIISET